MRGEIECAPDGAVALQLIRWGLVSGVDLDVADVDSNSDFADKAGRRTPTRLGPADLVTLAAEHIGTFVCNEGVFRRHPFFLFSTS